MSFLFLEQIKKRAASYETTLFSVIREAIAFLVCGCFKSIILLCGVWFFGCLKVYITITAYNTIQTINLAVIIYMSQLPMDVII